MKKNYCVRAYSMISRLCFFDFSTWSEGEAKQVYSRLQSEEAGNNVKIERSCETAEGENILQATAYYISPSS